MEVWALLFMLSFPADYLDVGIAYHSALDKPEVDLDNPLATFEVGKEVGKNITLYYNHTSSILTQEYGLGLNSIGIKYRFDL